MTVDLAFQVVAHIVESANSDWVSFDFLFRLLLGFAYLGGTVGIWRIRSTVPNFVKGVYTFAAVAAGFWGVWYLALVAGDFSLEIMADLSRVGHVLILIVFWLTVHINWSRNKAANRR